jgi:hypothetical protein
VEEDLPRSRWLIEIAKDQSSLMAPYGVDKHDFSVTGLTAAFSSTAEHSSLFKRSG